MNMAFYGKWFACLWLATSCVQAASTDNKALEIIRRADEIRSPNKPFRYTLTVTEYKAGVTQPENKQVLDISMRFMKPQGNEKADARSLVRFIYPPRDKGKSCFPTGTIYGFTRRNCDVLCLFHGNKD